MVESERLPGLWQCPGYRKALNDRPPFRFACTGMELTQQAYDDIEAALVVAWRRDVAGKN